MIEVCLCTFDPRPDVLDLVLKSVAAQTVAPEHVRFLLIDNASPSPLKPELLKPLAARGWTVRLIREPRAGIFHARTRAMRESTTPLILWIDDDTELPPRYVQDCLEIAAAHPEIGCFGGKLTLGPSCRYPRWTESIHPWLAIIDRGNEVITNKADHWGLWEPPTAGAVVRRAVADCYLNFISSLPAGYSIGQVGNKDLLRGEDSLLMRMAHRVDLACSYQPRLQLIHHIDNRRFRAPYLLRLFQGYGRSYVRLERILGQDLPPLTRKDAWEFFWKTRLRREAANWGIFLLMKAWNWGFIRERTVQRA